MTADKRVSGNLPQEESCFTGLQILARMIARAHLRNVLEHHNYAIPGETIAIQESLDEHVEKKT